MKMRKFLAILCVIAMLCSLAPMVSAEDSTTETTLYEGDTTLIGGGWQTALTLSTTNDGGQIDPAVITEDGYFSVYFDYTVANPWDFYGMWLVLKSTAETDNWHQLDDSYFLPCDGGFVATFSYDTCVKVYGSADFSDLSNIVVGINAVESDAVSVTVSKVTYTTGFGECEVVAYTGDAALTGWNEVAVIPTTNNNGQLDPNSITAGGALYVYFTGTQCWQIRVGISGTNGSWAELDCHGSDKQYWNAGRFLKLTDGVSAAVFTYDEIVAKYGSTDLSGLGSILIYSNSGDPVTVTKVSYISDHDYAKQTLGTKVSDATCTAAATYYVACDKCGADSENIVSSGELAAHSYTTKDSGTQASAATCTEAQKNYVQCDHCTSVSDSVTVVVGEAKGHDYEVTDSKNATCTEDGYKVYACKNDSSHTYTETQKAAGHKDEDQDLKCDVCEANLCQTHTDVTTDQDHLCDVCGAVCGEHSYTDVVTAPTCETKGYTTHTCDCGDSYKDSETNAKGHKWDDGKVTTAATCTEDGVKTYTCQNDPTHTKTEAVNATGHKHEKVVTAPTCEAEGYTTYTCACGDTYVGDKVAANGHTWDNGVVTKEATTESAGEKTYTCSVCKSTKTTAIAKLPAPGGSTTEIYTGNTAVESGWQMAVRVDAKAWNGPLDAAATLTEGGHVSVNLTSTTADIWSASVILQGTGSSNGWQQIDQRVESFVKNDDGSYTATFTYDELVKAYGGSDFSDLGSFYIYVNSAAGCSITVTGVEYVVPAAEGNPDQEENQKPEQNSKPTTVDTPVFTGEAAATGSWSIITEVLTTPFEGTMDPSIVNEDGYISVYYTGTSGQIYLALQDGTNWGWYQIDTPSTTTAVDGGYVSTYSYADLAKAYGKEDFSDLGKVIIGSGNADDIVISQIAWTQTSSNADTGDGSMVMLAMVLMVMMAACMVTTVSLKKRR